MSKKPESLLDLSSTRELLLVRIDGVEYPLRQRADLNLREYRTLERKLPRAGALLEADELSPDEERELAVLLDEACRIVLDAPADVQDRLGDVNRTRILDTYLQTLVNSTPSPGTNTVN